MPRFDDVIAYQYEGDRFCLSCTLRRFELDEMPPEFVDWPVDNEGNTVSAIFRDDDWYEGYNSGVYEQTLECGLCSHTLASHYDDSYCSCNDGCFQGECGNCEDEEDDTCSCQQCLDAESYDPQRGY